MDPLIKSYPCEIDADLCLCIGRGIAYQRDMSAGRVAYDQGYWEKVAAYEGSMIQREVIRGRLGMVSRTLAKGSTLLDIGAGTGAFVAEAVREGFLAKGFEVMPAGRTMLEGMGVFDLPDNIGKYSAITMWDAIEHIEDPQHLLRRVRLGAALFVSVPIFLHLTAIRHSKHYRPGEHLYYFTPGGLVGWLEQYGFRCVEASRHEIAAGRESIGAFAFIRDRGE